MICRDCANAVIGNAESDLKMAKDGYKSCAAARSAEERGRYIKGDTECIYPNRSKAK